MVSIVRNSLLTLCVVVAGACLASAEQTSTWANCRATQSAKPALTLSKCLSSHCRSKLGEKAPIPLEELRSGLHCWPSMLG